MVYHILVVDDEADLFALFKKRFRDEINSGKLVFHFAENGKLALERLKQDQPFHLLFTDIKMPVMDGLTLLNHVKELNLDIKTVVVSAYDDISNIRTAMNRDAFDFLVKPISFDDLRATLEKTIRGYDAYMDGQDTRKKLIEAVKEKEAAILRERLRISRDLHDDLGASLSGITIYAATAQNKLADASYTEAQDLLNRIATDSREMVSTMSEMVWLINPRNDNMEKLFDRIRSYAAGVLSAKNILFSFNDAIDLNPVVLSIEARKNIYLILKESVNNAVKHSSCTELKLVVEKEADKIKFTVADNGTGIPQTQIDSGNGLKNMRQRASEINAEVSFESYSGKGTNIVLLANLDTE